MGLIDGLRPPVTGEMDVSEHLPNAERAGDSQRENGDNTPIIQPETAPVAVFDRAVEAKFQEVVQGKNLTETGSAVARVAAMGEVLRDEKLRDDMKRGQAKVLKNDTAADVLGSKIKVQQHRANNENILYERYRYVFGMLGISRQIPNFMCVVLLAIYAVVGTVLAVSFGALFLVTNYIIEGVRGVFSRLTELFATTSGLAKGLALSSVFLLILGLVAAVVFIILKYTIL